MMKHLEIFAGKSALETIKKNGFSEDMFDLMLGASGGPKWFVLFGLDKYIFGEFFANRQKPLHTLGSSAGAFRFACFGQKDPVSAISRLADVYSKTTYSKSATSAEITQKAVDMLDVVLEGNAIEEIIDNPVVKTHFIVAKANGGAVASENKVVQTLGLTKSYLLNRLGRKHLSKQYSRYIFCANESQLSITDPYHIPSKFVPLSSENLFSSLKASGAIPIVIDGVKDISGAEKGIYRDGGIIDYHFDLELRLKSQKQRGLTLYPHFSSSPRAGWFDKSLSRKVSQSNYDNVVFLAPSRAFVEALPNRKIPDRKDFEKIEASTRIKMWQRVLEQSQYLADDFSRFIESQDVSQIKPFIAT